MCLGDINGHVSGHIDGIDGVHGEFGVGQRHLEGRLLLELCWEKELWLKRVEKRKVEFGMRAK